MNGLYTQNEFFIRKTEEGSSGGAALTDDSTGVWKLRQI